MLAGAYDFSHFDLILMFDYLIVFNSVGSLLDLYFNKSAHLSLFRRRSPLDLFL